MSLIRADITINVDLTNVVLDKLQDVIEKSLNDIGETATKYAKDDCPVDTGRLKKSITHKENIQEKYTEIGVPVGDTYYGKYVEYGTYKMKAQPFIYPAVMNHISEYENIVKKNGKNA